ncbi:MAG: peptidase M75 [Kofleriaceae bacterium]|nr:peptidase M75 [Kofleriaceae bacterium]MBP9202340.1 peptidase M75 [Kofleriaceae bacterium]
MKGTLMRPVLLALLTPTALVLAACGDDGGTTPSGFDDAQVIADFADQVVVPTYQLLATRTAALDAALATLAATPNEANLTAARQAWVAMRVPWEQSEAFLFGPVSAQGWDPAMDSWPLNQTDLDAVLATQDPLTQAYVRNLPETQKGFHTLEYLLWGVDSAKPATALTPRELEYVGALGDELVLITTDLVASWTDAGGYRATFATAGQAGNTAYPSLGAAAQEILGGMSGICDEVANGKIADPYDARDPNLVESQYSFNSLLDFADNVRGVRNAYTGDAEAAGTMGRGLADVVAAADPALDTRLRAELDAAIAALAAVPGLFRDAITDPANDAAIEAAQAAIRTVQATIDGDLTTVVLGS